MGMFQRLLVGLGKGCLCAALYDSLRGALRLIGARVRFHCGARQSLIGFVFGCVKAYRV